MGMHVIEHLAELMECCDSIVTHGMQMQRSLGCGSHCKVWHT